MLPIRFGEGFWLWLGVLLGLVFALRLGLGFGAVQHPAVSPGHQCHRVTGVRAEHGQDGDTPGAAPLLAPRRRGGLLAGRRRCTGRLCPLPSPPSTAAAAGPGGRPRCRRELATPPRSPPLLTLPRTAPRSGRPHAWAPLPPPTPAGAPPRATTGRGLADIPPISGGAASPPR